MKWITPLLLSLLFAASVAASEPYRFVADSPADMTAYVECRDYCQLDLVSTMWPEPKEYALNDPAEVNMVIGRFMAEWRVNVVWG